MLRLVTCSAEDFDLLADEVVDGADDVPAQGRPGVAGQHRREIAGVDQRDRLALPGPLNLGDRQHLVAGQVLRREQQPHVQRPQLHFLVVAAEALVLERLDGLDVAGLAGVRAGATLALPSLSFGTAKKTRTTDSLANASFKSTRSSSSPGSIEINVPSRIRAWQALTWTW